MRRYQASRKRSVARSALTLGVVVMLAASAFWLVGLHRVYVVHTGSMGPTIPSGSAVVVEPQYHVGQVITFKTHGQVVTHRLEGVRSDGEIVTKGDANQSADPWMAQQGDIIGGVIAAPPYLGYFLVYLQQPVGSLSILLLVWLAFELEGALGDIAKRQKPGHRAGVVPTES